MKKTTKILAIVGAMLLVSGLGIAASASTGSDDSPAPTVTSSNDTTPEATDSPCMDDNAVDDSQGDDSQGDDSQGDDSQGDDSQDDSSVIQS